MSNTCALPSDPKTLQTALDEVGWKPKRGEGLADGLSWLVDCAVELRYLQEQHEQLRARLSLRVDELDELKVKFHKTVMARLHVVSELRELKKLHAELETKFYKGWEAERDRLQEQIDELETTKRRYDEALWEIEHSRHSSDRPRPFSSARHKWCVDRAMGARKALMPCDGCDVSHQCMNAYDELNRGRFQQKDCHHFPEKWFFQ